MCQLCRDVEAETKQAELPAPRVKALLERIAAAQAAGQRPEHFDRVTDLLLGTTPPESDPEKDRAWERSRRPTDSTERS